MLAILDTVNDFTISEQALQGLGGAASPCSATRDVIFQDLADDLLDLNRSDQLAIAHSP
jgi:hypothetical protein